MCKAIQEWMKSSREEGLEQGMDRTMLLIEKMTAAGETDKLSQLSSRDFLQEMLKKYGL